MRNARQYMLVLNLCLVSVQWQQYEWVVTVNFSDTISTAEITHWLEFVVPFQHKYGYIRDERSGMESYPYPVKEG